MNGYQIYIRETDSGSERGQCDNVGQKNIAYENLGRVNQWGGLAERT